MVDSPAFTCISQWLLRLACTACSANYVLCFLLEPCRLYLGYAGNLGEKVGAPAAPGPQAMVTSVAADLRLELLQ